MQISDNVIDKIVIIGGGIAGATIALELADKGYHVTLLEQANEILPKNSTSSNECFKLHLGGHYLAHIETAKKCLESAIAFVRKYPNWIVAPDDLNHPLRRGRQYIPSDSRVKEEKIREVAEQLRQHYKNLIAEDEGNQVFGKPEDFIKYLTPEDYPHVAEEIVYYDADDKPKTTKIKLGIEMPESQIHYEKMKSELNQRIKNHPRIKFVPNSKVTSIRKAAEGEHKYIVTTEGKTNKTEYGTNRIINCSWESAEVLDKTAEHATAESPTMRAKVSVVVNLPESMKNLNTFTFSIGPFSTITILPDGKGILTSEHSTNFDDFNVHDTGKKDRIMQQFSEQKEELGRKILQEAALYLAEPYRQQLLDSKIEEVRLGLVKIKDPDYKKDSIYQLHSSVHERLENGIVEHSPDYYTASAMKMTYAVKNAQQVAKLVEKHNQITQNQINKMIAHVSSQKYIERLFDSLKESRELFFKQNHVKILEISRLSNDKQAGPLTDLLTGFIGKNAYKRSPTLMAQQSLSKIPSLNLDNATETPPRIS